MDFRMGPELRPGQVVDLDGDSESETQLRARHVVIDLEDLEGESESESEIPNNMDYKDEVRHEGFMDGEELRWDFCAGGHHPVDLGNGFSDGRYRISNKLGVGGFASVWLAWDTKDKKWASLKILKADHTKTHGKRELANLQDLQKKSNYVVRLLDHFYHEGPNGVHLCLVQELLGPTLNKCMELLAPEEDTPLALDLVAQITEEVLKELTDLHATGYTHGDFSPSNIVVYAPELTSMTEQELDQLMGEPPTQDIWRTDDELADPEFPAQSVGSTWWPGWKTKPSEFRFIDLSESFTADDVPSKFAQPDVFKPPEILFIRSDTKPCDNKMDLWQFGMIMCQLLYLRLPFYANGNVRQAQEMIKFTGPLPELWRPPRVLVTKKWEKGDTGDEPQIETAVDGVDLDRTSYAREAFKNPHFPRHTNTEEEALQLSRLHTVLDGLLRLAPEERMSAATALQVMRGDHDQDKCVRPRGLTSSQQQDDTMPAAVPQTSNGAPKEAANGIMKAEQAGETLSPSQGDDVKNSLSPSHDSAADEKVDENQADKEPKTKRRRARTPQRVGRSIANRFRSLFRKVKS